MQKDTNTNSHTNSYTRQGSKTKKYHEMRKAKKKSRMFEKRRKKSKVKICDTCGHVTYRLQKLRHSRSLINTQPSFRWSRGNAVNQLRLISNFERRVTQDFYMYVILYIHIYIHRFDLFFFYYLSSFFKHACTSRITHTKKNDRQNNFYSTFTHIHANDWTPSVVMRSQFVPYYLYLCNL